MAGSSTPAIATVGVDGSTLARFLSALREADGATARPLRVKSAMRAAGDSNALGRGLEVADRCLETDIACAILCAAMSSAARMHQTTIRFVPRVWEQLEQEAARQGVSSAQYVREATIARLAYDASAREGSADFLRYDGERAGAAMQAAGEHRADSEDASRQAERRSAGRSPRHSHHANRERR